MDGAGAGIMLDSGRGGLRFAAASAERIVHAEEIQQQVRSGACYEAFMTNEVVVVDDLAGTSRWPVYRTRVLGLGLRAVIGLPLNAFGRTIGVLNVYRDSPTSWSRDDVASGQILSAMAATYIVHADRLRAQHDLTESLHRALGSRDLIGQAKGILMARDDLDPDEAFTVLREASQDGNRKLLEVARNVIEGGTAG